MSLFKNFINVEERWLQRYINLINSYENYEGNGEKHHILPTSLFPEYSKIDLNIKNIPHRVHFLLHYILFKMVKDKKQKKSMTFAFNMMRRVGSNSSLYEMNRNIISLIISETNKNRKVYNNGEKEIRLKETDIIPNGFIIGLLKKSIEARKDFAKNFAIVTINGKNKVISRKDSNYIIGLYDDCRVGKTHSNETKEKMSKNGIIGKTAYSHKDGTVIFLNADDKIPNGFIKGNIISKRTCTFKENKLHYHNPLTNERVRLKGNDIIPDGFIKGRGSFNNVGSKGLSYFTNGINNAMFKKGQQPYGWVLGTNKQSYFKVYKEKEFIGYYSKSEIIYYIDKQIFNKGYFGYNVEEILVKDFFSKKFKGIYND